MIAPLNARLKAEAEVIVVVGIICAVLAASVTCLSLLVFVIRSCFVYCRGPSSHCGLGDALSALFRSLILVFVFVPL